MALSLFTLIMLYEYEYVPSCSLSPASCLTVSLMPGDVDHKPFILFPFRDLCSRLPPRPSSWDGRAELGAL